MYLVDRPTLVPGHCIVNPGCSEDPRGFIDMGFEVEEIQPRIYVSAQAVIDMGRLFDFPSPEEHVELAERLAKAEDALEDVQAQLAEADRYAEAAEYTLKATFGAEQKIKNKPGPRPAARKP